VDGGADFAKHVNMQTNLTVGTGIIATTGNIEATAGNVISYGAGAVATNFAAGNTALDSNTTGAQNTAVGVNALTANTTGIYNTAIGYAALAANIGGESNTAIGREALDENTTGYQNTAMGANALGEVTTGIYNTAIGYSAGSSITTGSNLICLGRGSAPSAINATNQVTLGDSNITSLRCAVTTITAISDKRDKADIENLIVGLDFIMKLQPKKFKFDKREWYEDNKKDGLKKEKEINTGLIAQDVLKIEDELNISWMKIVNRENPDKYEMSIGKILMPLVIAVQELKTKIDVLENKFCEKS
jgi:hypothetical protein